MDGPYTASVSGNGSGRRMPHVVDWDPQLRIQSSDMPGMLHAVREYTPRVFGFPIGALAYDNSHEAMYVASTTQPVSTARWKSHRASMLVTCNSRDGTLYSSCAGHAEAPAEVLEKVYTSMFGSVSNMLQPEGRPHIPLHAYRPPFGGSATVSVPSQPPRVGGAPPPKQSHIGVTTLLPLDNCVASISPSSVRIHTRGGLQIRENDIEGMLCGDFRPQQGLSPPSHLVVGGTSMTSMNKPHNIHSLDLWQDLKIISSRTLKDKNDASTCVSCMATSHDRGSIVVGCTDGHMRLVDGSLRELATVKSHAGGVSCIAISENGTMVATAGYSSRSSGKGSSSLYAFPDATILLYDIRYLGRGGVPHPFTGARGAPRFLTFLPYSGEQHSNRLLAVSGQPGGGIQMISPFADQVDSPVASFYSPQLEQGESVTAIDRSNDEIALGTSKGRLLHYCLKHSDADVSMIATGGALRSGIFVPSKGKTGDNRPNREKKPLKAPPYAPVPPPVSLNPRLLLSNGNTRTGTDDRFKSIFSSYVMRVDPKLSKIGNIHEDAVENFGKMAKRAAVAPNKRSVAPSLIEKVSTDQGDYLRAVPTADVLPVDLLSNLKKISHAYKGKKGKETTLNPNKILYTPSLFKECYVDDRKQKASKPGERTGSNDEKIPFRYRLKLRPKYKTSGAFNPAEYNKAGLYPGWDYPPAMPNAFASPVILLLYFMPEIRSAVLASQFEETMSFYEKALSPELGFVFHQIDSLSKFSYLYPSPKNSGPIYCRIGAWNPSNFLTTLSTMPEAEQLQILDGSPEAVEPPRRPEAFYRFLAHQLDREMSGSAQGGSVNYLLGIDFACVNEFVNGTGPPSQSSSRALSIDLSYSSLMKRDREKNISFAEILCHTLSRETRLRAWNKDSRAYETVIQRKIATSLPKVLTLSCACAGRKEDDGLRVWRGEDSDGNRWLPEMVEVELRSDGKIIVRELVSIDEKGEEIWESYTLEKGLPESVSKSFSSTSGNRKFRYRLDAVVSFIRDSVDCDEDDGEIAKGHHVIHIRVPPRCKENTLFMKQREIERLVSKLDKSPSTLKPAVADISILRQRSEYIKKCITSMGKVTRRNEWSSDWILFNGFVVSDTVVEDALAFHTKFKEPCLVVFREIGSYDNAQPDISQGETRQTPEHVMVVRSISNAQKESKPFRPDMVKAGQLVAFDAEFVSVQEEEVLLTESGNKLTLRDTRHALARISVIDCRDGKVILDDYVIPSEPVVDYLTRFSGIVASDLDPLRSPHSLVSTRTAYLKLRYLLERGCVFVGHGLRQDFLTVNLVVPPDQIIDTVEIFHQPGMRYISLRYLANYVLGRDMQQDTHDSIEDALAAFHLYEKALEWKKAGTFDKEILNLYSSGQKSGWKLGVGDC